MKLLIASPSITGEFCGEYVGSLIGTLNLLAQRKVEAEWFFVRGNSEISRCRDGLASYALRNGFSHLLFIDADEGWKPDAVGRLLDSPHPIVGGTYFKKGFPLDFNFGVLPVHDHYFAGGVKSPECFRNFALAEADAAGEVPIAFLPTGFMLIDCKVFEKMKEHAPEYLSRDSASAEEVRCWEFFPIGVIAGRKDTEDWGFCRFAAACGFQPHLNVHCIADHVGPFVYTAPAGLLHADPPARA